MDTTLKYHLTLLFVILMMVFSVDVNAQRASLSASVTATACATIIEPMIMTEQNTINFGVTTKKSGLAGKVILSTNNATVNYEGGVSGTAKTGEAVSNAIFNITGDSNCAFTLNFPNKITVEGPDTMVIIIDDLKIRFNDASKDFAINNNNSISNMLNTRSTETFRLGGRLNIKADQHAGTYSGTYNVIVDYN